MRKHRPCCVESPRWGAINVATCPVRSPMGSTKAHCYLLCGTPTIQALSWCAFSLLRWHGSYSPKNKLSSSCGARGPCNVAYLPLFSKAIWRVVFMFLPHAMPYFPQHPCSTAKGGGS